jgi:integrase
MESLDEQVATFARWFSIRSKPRTVKEYSRAVLRMCKRAGCADVRTLRRDRVVEAVAAMPATKLRHNDLAALLAFCRWAHQEAKLIPSLIVDGIDLGPIPTRRKDRTMRPFTEADVAALIRVAEEDERRVRPRCRASYGGPKYRSHFYAVLGLVGGRWREMCGPTGIKWRDVDLSEPEPCITFDSEVSKNRDEGVVPLLPSAADALRRWRKIRAADAPTDPVFAETVYLGTLHSDMAAAGIPKRDEKGRPAGWHSFRRGLGSRMAKTVTPKVAQSMLRHKDIRITMQLYSELQTEEVRAAVAGLDRQEQKPVRVLPTENSMWKVDQGAGTADTPSEPEQATPCTFSKPPTGVEPVWASEGAGAETLMECARVLLATANRLMGLASRLMEPGNGCRNPSSPPPPPSAG